MPRHTIYLNDLLHATRQNDLDCVKQLMSDKLKPKDKNSQLFQCLAESQPATKTEDLQRLILEATALSNPAILKYFIKQGANINFACKFILGGKSDCNTTPLHVAVEKQSHDAIEVLINANANVNLPDSCGKTPLHHACQNCDVIATRLLACSGANTQLVDKRGTTALQLASKFGHVDLVRVLLDHNAQIFQEKQRGLSALHIAATEVSQVDLQYTINT